ncbi:MAG: glycine--tRNA ligase subunit beta [Alphaproteobacteria bacterium]|nr:glycine--tRNA ligase subunit beta [Alphaproteobacteria bacterium]
MPELILELFSEEIPARMQARAAADLERAVNQRLLDAGFLPEGVKAFAGPRRLALVAVGLPARQPDLKEEKKGPRVGAPEKAVEGFLKSAGLASLDDCETREDKKGAYYVAVVERKGRPTAELLGEFIPEIIRGFAWPKSMRWGAAPETGGELRWVRPLRRILCCFDGEVVPFEIGGIAAGDVTEGHRTMSEGLIQSRSFDTYAERLEAAKVMLDAEARAELIAREARTLCEAQGLEIVEDKGLLQELAGLAEWPSPMIGAFDAKFLSLPDEALIASMRGHQKYFSVRDPRTGRLANRFVCVANIVAPDGGAAMRAGYERVLTARLSDARYLYENDLKRPLEGRVSDLDGMTFFEGLGSTGDKARRVAALAREIAPSVGADPDTAERAGLLAKADLTTGMVYEFPELQGVMGRYYATAQGEPQQIADAIRDHYRPVGQDDDVPSAPVSVSVALADKIDTLTAFWSIGKKPTGSSDPFALRRAALGVIRIVLENGVRLPLPDEGDLLDFFHDRLKVYFRDKGRRHDHIDAVLHDADGNPVDDFVLIASKLDALEAFLKTAEGADLAAAYKRAGNILKAETKKGDAPSAGDVVDGALVEDAERALVAALGRAEPEVTAAMAAEDFTRAMAGLAALRAPLDAFFETVTVNADDPALRSNRLAILQRFVAATVRVADFSKLQG